MVLRLAQHGAAGYIELARALDVNGGTFAFHIRKLEGAGIIRAERNRQRTTFELTPKGRAMLMAERETLDAIIPAEISAP
jgi:DNA-binding MarR family transcriptional regulator